MFINPAVMSLPKHAHLMGGVLCSLTSVLSVVKWVTFQVTAATATRSTTWTMENRAKVCKLIIVLMKSLILALTLLDADALPLRYQSLLNCKKQGKPDTDYLHIAWDCEKNPEMINFKDQ